MKYLILSDIHGSLPALNAVLDFFERNSYDMLLLLGDILNYGPRNEIPAGINPQGIADRLNQISEKIVCVRGNCDSEVDQMLLNFPIMADYAWLVDEGKRIFLTHGHIYNDQKQPEGKFDLLFYGHTHLQHITSQENRGILVNVGSPTFPKGGNPPTFATYEAGVVRIHLLDGNVIKEHRL